MKRRLLYAISTLAGPWMIVAAVALELANFFQRGMPWRGEAMWTVDWFAISIFITGPLCAGAAAIDAARLSRPGNVHLVVSAPSQARSYVRAMLWCAVPMATVHLLAITLGLVLGGVQQPRIGWPLLTLAITAQLGSYFWHAAVGSVIGRFANPLLAGLAASGLTFMLSYAIGDSIRKENFALLSFGAATVSRIGLTYNTTYIASQAAILLITAAIAAVVPIRIRAGWKLPSVAGAVAITAVAATILTAHHTLPIQRNVLAQPEPPTWCVGTAPTVCLYPEHRRFAPSLTASLEQLLTPARHRGYDALVPSRVMENSTTFNAPTRDGIATLWLPLEMYQSGEMLTEDLAYQLIEPEHCPALRSRTPPPAAYDERIFSVLATWLDFAQIQVGHSFPVPVRQLSSSEVQQIVKEFADCNLTGER